MVLFNLRSKGFACLLTAAVALLPSTSAPTAASLKELEVVIVAHTTVPSASLSKSEMENLLLGKSTTWSDDSKVVLAGLDDDEIHSTFVVEFTGKTAAQYKTYWKKRVFTGKGKAPKTLRSEERLIDFVARTPGAVGYVSRATATDPKIVNDPKTKEPRIQTLSRK
jgi:ABC-type phosphate transport system substrate-binding protein